MATVERIRHGFHCDFFAENGEQAVQKLQGAIWMRSGRVAERSAALAQG